MKKLGMLSCAVACVALAGLIVYVRAGEEKKEKEGKSAVSFTEDFNLGECAFSAAGGNRYFILKPGYQLTLEDGKSGKLVITVMDETKKVGNVETRIVEERETEDGELIEVSRNFFAIDTKTNSVFYFGEDVDMYKEGKITGHGGSWLAEGKNKPGVMIPGIILLGSRYYQEIAPEVAMDRAEIVSMSEKLETTAGKFENCLKTEETTPLEPNAKEYKIYAPGIGLIKDGDLLLTKYGNTKK
jgi:hypothetical protein